MADKVVLTTKQWDRVKRGLARLEAMEGPPENVGDGWPGDFNFQPVKRVTGDPVTGDAGRDLYPGKIVWLPPDDDLSEFADCWIDPGDNPVPAIGLVYTAPQSGYFDDGDGHNWPVFATPADLTGGYRFTSTPSETADVVDVADWDAVKRSPEGIAGLSGSLTPERLVTVIHYDPTNPEGTNGTWADLAGLWTVWDGFPGTHPYRPIVVTAVSTPDGWIPVAAHAGATSKYIQMGHPVANKFGATTDAPIKIGYGDADDEDTFDRIEILLDDFQPWVGGPPIGPLFITGRGHQFLVPDVPVLGVDDGTVCLTFDHFDGMTWKDYFSASAISDLAGGAISDVVPGMISDALAGFDKTIILPVGDGFAALFCVEAPEVRFEDVLRVPLAFGRAVVDLDPRFVEVCEPGSIVVVGAVPASLAVMAARVEGTRLYVEADRPVSYVTVKLSGVRVGRRGVRFPACTAEQMAANNAFYAQARGQRP